MFYNSIQWMTCARNIMISCWVFCKPVNPAENSQ
jgi:hypothetical protein